MITIERLVREAKIADGGAHLHSEPAELERWRVMFTDAQRRMGRRCPPIVSTALATVERHLARIARTRGRDPEEYPALRAQLRGHRG